MKLSYLTLLVLITLGFVSCRKDKEEIDIKQYDDQQIQAYIANNGFSNMKRAQGDTSGIYYEILSQGTGAAFTYKDTISFTYSIQSLDGLYNITDTILNHSKSYAGQLTPNGLFLAVNNFIKNKGTKARFLIPSRLAYGINGAGLGSGRLRGNQSLLYYVNVISNQDDYDDACIQSYFKTNSINPAEYTKITSGRYKGCYYKIRKAGTGTTLINESSKVTVYYRGKLLNNTIFEPANYSDTNLATPLDDLDLTNPNAVIPGFREAVLLGEKEGTDLTIIMPSRLAYGATGQQNSAGVYVIPQNSCLYFDMTIGTVTNP